MQDKELYEKLLGLKAPWRVGDADLRMEESKVRARLEHEPLARFACPECGPEGPTHDHRPRQWRHPDIFGIVTMVEADIPRVDCRLYGASQAKVPWAEPGSGFTAMFEASAIQELAIDEASFHTRHEYVTALVDRKTGLVIDILDDRKKATLKKWLEANKDRLHEVR
jgi:transposase